MTIIIAIKEPFPYTQAAKIDVYWDLSFARFGVGPEPIGGVLSRSSCTSWRFREKRFSSSPMPFRYPRNEYFLSSLNCDFICSYINTKIKVVPQGIFLNATKSSPRERKERLDLSRHTFVQM